MRPPVFANPMSERRQDIALAATAHLLDLQPNLEAHCGAERLKRCVEETSDLVLHLSQAIATDVPQLFEDYIGWLRVVWAHTGIPEPTLPLMLKAVATVLPDFVGIPLALKGADRITRVLGEYHNLPQPPVSYIDEQRPLGKRTSRFLRALLGLQREEAAALIEDAVRAGTTVQDIYIELFQPALYEVGRLWQTNRISVATEHYCATVCELLMDQLQAQIPHAASSKGTLVVACVPGELHELGCRMVAHLLYKDGWDTIYLGANVPQQAIIETLTQSRARMLCLSMSMARHLNDTADLIASIRQLLDRTVPIMIGGAVFNRVPELWRRLGADAAAPDAQAAVGACAAILDRDSWERSRSQDNA